jgi:hypothetical protein
VSADQRRATSHVCLSSSASCPSSRPPVSVHSFPPPLPTLVRRYATTTEVYPDSPKATPEQCNKAQVQTLTAGLDYIMKAEGLARPAAGKAEL